jgi:hypothetical protein
MIRDPERRGRALAEFFLAVEPRLYVDLAEAGVVPDAGDAPRSEWQCFALYACVRGLVAAGGFNRETAAAIDALHERVLQDWMAASAGDAGFEARRDRIAERYREYGEIGQAGGASGAVTVTRRLGEAAARHIAASDPAPEPLIDLVGSLHETLVEARQRRCGSPNERRTRSAADHFMHHLKSAPPIAPLLDRVTRLERAGLTVALGGSGLLAALGLTDQVRDWDLTTDATLETAQAALAGESLELHGHDDLHADHKRCSTAETSSSSCGWRFTSKAAWSHPDPGERPLARGPVGKPGGLGGCLLAARPPGEGRSLFTHLAARGADRGAVGRLRAEPLPSELADRLAALPLR